MLYGLLHFELFQTPQEQAIVLDWATIVFYYAINLYFFAVVLIGSSETATEGSKNVIGVLLIALNVWFVVTSFLGWRCK